MKCTLVSPTGYRSKSIKVGVSWTYLLFGGWALLFSGKWILILVELILDVLTSVTGISGVLLVVYHIYLFFFGNKTYIQYLKYKGWTEASE